MLRGSGAAARTLTLLGGGATDVMGQASTFFVPPSMCARFVDLSCRFSWPCKFCSVPPSREMHDPNEHIHTSSGAAGIALTLAANSACDIFPCSSC